jgi:hypothetical protein
MRTEPIIILLLSVLTVHAAPIKLPNLDEEYSHILRFNENRAEPVRTGYVSIPDNCPQPPDSDHGILPQCVPVSPKAKFKLPFNDGKFKCEFKIGERGVASRGVASEIPVMSFFVICSPSDKDDWKHELSTGRVGKTDSVEYGPYQVTFSETSEGVFPEIDELKLAAAASFDEFRNANWDNMEDM